MKIVAGAAAVLLAGMLLPALNGPQSHISYAAAHTLSYTPHSVAASAAGNSRLQGSPQTIRMTDASHGWGISAGKVWLTADGGRSWRPSQDGTLPLPGGGEQLSGLAVHFPGANTGWIVSAYGPQQAAFVFHTADQGQSWRAARLPVKAGWERGYVHGFFDFPSKDNGYLLLNSEPGAGIMEKSLYHTADGGKSWSRTGDITAAIQSYPTGMAFRDRDNGWITSSYHGQDFILTFRTRDGGKSWVPEKLAGPPALAGYAYSNSYPPVFSGRGGLLGVLPLEIVQDGNPAMVYYTTKDGGEHWKVGPEIRGVQATRTAWMDARIGWALQEGGKLLNTVDGGRSWSRTARSALFDKAEQIEFTTVKNGWISGPGLLWSTSDGGHSWRNLLQ